MTAAVYRWLLGQLEGITGEGAIVYVGVIAFLSVAAGYALYELVAYLWTAYAVARDRRRAQPWPIRFVERPISHGARWPMLAELAIVALIVGLMVTCGVAK